MKKFYKTAEAGRVPDGYAVLLDGKPLKTPLKKLLLLPSIALADAVAHEWECQECDIRPSLMPLTQLSNTMIDKAGGDDRSEMNLRILEYGSSDLVCYFAEHPDDLVKRHHLCWMPLLTWMREQYGIVFKTTSGIRHCSQPQESMDKLEKLINEFTVDEFTVIQAASATTGSVVIAFALLKGQLSPEEAWQAACVDEIFQIETWGDDVDARKRLDAIRSELDLINRFRNLVKA